MTAKRLINAVTFFGDSAIPEGDSIYESVWETARYLAEHGYSIVNGGGPGIMKAATDGAESVNGHTVAVYWEPRLAAYFEGKNLANITDESEHSANYLTRTLGLIERGDAYIVCKGGTGTISEFAMVWALSKLYYGAHKPVILFGDFWDGLIEAFQKAMILDEIELGVLYQARTKEEVLKLLQEHEKKVKFAKIPESGEDERAFLISGNIDRPAKVHKGPQTASSASTPANYNKVAATYHAKHAGQLVAQKQLDEFISLVNPPAKILDVGTGPGYDANYLSGKYSVVGIESARRFTEIAKFENPHLEIYNADIVDFPLPTKAYKGIWARDSLHHVSAAELPKVMAKLSNALVDGGILYVIVREGEGEVVEVDNRNGQDIEKFFHLFSAEELTQLARSAGLELVKIDHTKRSHHWLVGVFQKPV